MQNVPSLILILPLLGFLFLTFFGKRAGKKVVAWVAPGVVLGAFAVSLYTLFNIVLPADHDRVIVPLIPFTQPDTPWIKFGGFEVHFALLLDPLSMLMAMIVTGVGGLIHIYATGYMSHDPEQPRFFSYFNLFIFMMLLLVMGENFLLMFVGWEGVGSCSYLLISFWYTKTENSRAGNKAFIVNRVGDLGFALGMMAIWSVFGTLSFYGHGSTQGVLDFAAKHIDMNGNNLDNLPMFFGVPAITAICILLFVGAMGKSAQLPLWVWLPDAMAGPTPVSALIHAATMVTAGVVMLTRCSHLFVLSPVAMEIVAWVGLATAFMGATIGLVQNDIKRVLAFSTVSQLGYMFLACGVGAFTAGMFHVTTHAFFKALLFLGSGAVIHSMHGEQDMRKMGGLKKLIPKTWLMMWIGTIAIAGIPPLAGFWSKDEILHSASGAKFGVIFYVVGLLTAGMTAFYMWRLMAKTFHTAPRFADGELPDQHYDNFQGDVAHGHHAAHGHGDAVHAADDHHNAEGHAGHHGGKVHESPFSMLFPLYVLAFLSVAAGIALGPTKVFEKFLHPSVAAVATHGSTDEQHHEQTGAEHGLVSVEVGYVISAIVAVAFVGLAWWLYTKNSKTGELMPEEKKAKNPIYQFLQNKWCFDWLYELIFIKIGGKFADLFLWKLVDVRLIDGSLNALAGLVGGLSKLTRRVQTGFVRTYALAMLLGVVVLVVGMYLTWTNLSNR